VIDISYIGDEIELPGEEQFETTEPPPPARPRWHRWAAFGAAGAMLVGLFAVASSRTQPPDRLRSADGVGVGQVYTVAQRFGQSWMRITEITLTAATADGDPAALFIIEGRGWLPQQRASLTAQACGTGEVTTVGSWVVGGQGAFRFADTDPGGGTYVLTIEGLESDPVRVLIGPDSQRTLGPLERGCPEVA
jgi:hypothetical protein